MNRRENRTWGYFEILKDDFPNLYVKFLCVYPCACISYQKHANRDEFWHICNNNKSYLIVTSNDNQKFNITSDDITIKRGTWHQICNYHYLKPLYIIETSIGNFDENDIVRLTRDRIVELTPNGWQVNVEKLKDETRQK